MLSLKRLLDRSLTAQAVLVFLLGLGITALFRTDEHPAVWVLHSALYTGIAMAFLAVQRRRAARAVGTDAGGLADLNRKIRHHEVPQEPKEQAAVRRLVAEQLDEMERARKWLPYWLGAMGIVAIGLVVLGAVRQRVPRLPPLSSRPAWSRCASGFLGCAAAPWSASTGCARPCNRGEHPK